MPEPGDIRTILAFDFGTRKYGVATGQCITATAGPLPPMPSRDGAPEWPLVDAVLAEWQPQALLVGLPLNMDDSESELSRLARKFARRLEARYRLPVWMVDERLTSRAARDLLAEAGSRHKGKLASVDSTAAVLLAEAWLENPAIGHKP
jgi:putative Holliday junction resolvase